MKKFITLFLCIFSLYVFAEEPHIIPAVGCKEGETCCPEAIVCSYLEGCGDSGEWLVNGNFPYFEGVKKFYPMQISAVPYSGKYKINCSYGNISERIFLYSNEKTILIGNWIYGFMKKNAICPNNEALNCTAK